MNNYEETHCRKNDNCRDWRLSAVVITTRQLHSTKPIKFMFSAGSNPTRSVSGRISDNGTVWK